jgi:hypothetical protein
MPEFDLPLDDESRVPQEALNAGTFFAFDFRVCGRFLRVTDWKLSRGSFA